MSTPDRMLSILDLFRDDTTAAFQEDVMAHLECSRATAYRYLKSLTESGLLAPPRAAPTCSARASSSWTGTCAGTIR